MPPPPIEPLSGPGVQDVHLASRPSKALKVYTHDPPNAKGDSVLIVTVNGMVAPMGGWKGVFDRLEGKYRLLAFDRYGQAQSADSHLGDEPHDVVDFARYTGELIDWRLKGRTTTVPIVFLGNSIGVPTIRLLAGLGLPKDTRFAGFVICDSMMASTDFVSQLPAQTEGEDPTLTAAREGVRQVFHPSAGNKERLDRSKLPELLPDAGKPALPDTPFVTILAQDHVKTAPMAGMISPGMTADLYLKHVASAWGVYNEGLRGLTSPDKVKGPITVPDSNHFIQVTRPDVVAIELLELLKKVEDP